jgi:hypothetical protein
MICAPTHLDDSASATCTAQTHAGRVRELQLTKRGQKNGDGRCGPRRPWCEPPMASPSQVIAVTEDITEKPCHHEHSSEVAARRRARKGQPADLLLERGPSAAKRTAELESGSTAELELLLFLLGLPRLACAPSTP